MADTVRRRLTGRVSGPRPTGREAWFMLAFSLPFLGVGIGIISWGLSGGEREGMATPQVLVAFGSLFAGVGLFLACTAAVGILRGARRKALLAGRPDEPWYADYPWDPQGASDQQPADIGRVLLFAVGWCGIVGVTQYMSLTGALGQFGVWALIAAAAIFLALDTIAVVLAVWLVRKIVRYFRYGRGYVRFRQFPYFLGERIELSVAVPPAVGSDRQIGCTLRFVEEVAERDGPQEGHPTAWQVYADTQTITLGRPFGRGEEVPVRFDLPTGDHGTRLAHAERRYWELQLKADRPGPDFEARFLLPIYPRPDAHA